MYFSLVMKCNHHASSPAMWLVAKRPLVFYLCAFPLPSLFLFWLILAFEHIEAPDRKLSWNNFRSICLIWSDSSDKATVVVCMRDISWVITLAFDEQQLWVSMWRPWFGGWQEIYVRPWSIVWYVGKAQ